MFGMAHCDFGARGQIVLYRSRQVAPERLIIECQKKEPIREMSGEDESPQGKGRWEGGAD